MFDNEITVDDPDLDIFGDGIPVEDPTPGISGNEIPVKDPTAGIPGDEIPVEDPTPDISGDEIPVEDPTPGISEDEIPVEDPTPDISDDEIPVKDPTPGIPGDEIPVEEPTPVISEDEIPVEDPTPNISGMRFLCGAFSDIVPTDQRPWWQTLASTDRGTEDECVCGNHSSHLSTRIVNGERTDLNEYPFMVLLLIQHNQVTSLCGGSLISSVYVLTAAHCVTSRHNGVTVSPGDVSISVGENNVDVMSIQINNMLTPSAVIAHPQYKKDLFTNDIALIRLNEELSLDETVNTVCLPVSHLSYTGTTATVIGWGLTSAFGEISKEQQEADIRIWDQQKCKNKWITTDVEIDSSMICAGGDETDSCSGDSGGPMVIKEDGRITIVGIVSFGLELCASSGWPSVYTRVSSFMDWIAENTMDSPPCYK
ncbi:chymotrypsinogen A-like [Limulus polyphemus]|uniref:Chymotrypsinogen A-like n=1 Tax=Limulus polyphemus TaxID=6850 RepID=A0ABM1BRD6_LIMPO|nr:chymotrypsinogen A-like [Limulus polyphemus]